MNTDRLLTAGIALCCIFAIGTSASTLGSSVNTNPDDVIDVDYESLPINPDDAGELKREAQSKDDPSSAKSKNDQQSQSNSKSGQSQQQSSASSQQQQNDQSNEGVSKSRLEILDRLLDLLRQLLRLFIWLVPVVAVVGGVALGVRFRDHLFGSETERSTASTPTPPPEPDPSNEVEQAWWTMVDQFGVERPHTKTPGECAREAIEAGADADAVETLTRTFEEVRYGGAPITDDRLDRIRHDRLGGQP